MKKTIIIFYLLLIITTSCESNNHYHDGKYFAEIEMFGFNVMKINYIISGDEITIDNSMTGISRLKCTQYKDRIEYFEINGTTKVLPVLENGDIQVNEKVVIKKLK